MSNFTKLKLCHTLGISQNTHFWVKGALTALLLVLCGNVAKAQSDLTFNEGIRYSKWVIDSRLGDFYGNRKKFGFTTYDSDLNKKTEVSTWYKEDGKTNYPIQVDYVAGLVAKATIEAAEYYQKFDWSKPWFKSVEWYGNKCTVPTSPNNLDAINASKMYFGIYNLATGTFKSDAESNTASNATKQLGYALTALGNYNKPDGTGGYAFPANTTVTRDGKLISLDGGWFHKESYLNEMWLDGQYMGPATLAQLIKGYSSYKALSSNDWELITKQFSIVWNMCWDETNKLLYHAFCSEPRSSTWAANAEIWTTAKTSTSSWKGMTAAGHSAAFWGRAEGWYFLALVDVLEQMQKAGLDSESVSNHDCYKTLKGYLDQLAAGIMAKQDKTSGCWYQLIAKDGSYSASYYRGKTYSAKSNYLESSCTAIFTAAYLKAIRLGLLDKTTYEDTAKRAYQGMIEQFMKQRTDGTVELLGCCKSAGLGTSKEFGNDKFRDGSNAYYLLGADVPQTSSSNSSDHYTEGKVLGAFILAATEYERQYQNKYSMLLSKDLNSKYTLSPNEPLTVEVLGDGTATYQWYDATETTPSAITDAKKASYIPTKSGKYYCEITVPLTSTAAKTRAESGSDIITTNTADVTVESTGTETGGEAGGSVTSEIIYFKNEGSNTSTKPSVVDASGAQTTTGSVTYNGYEYTNGVKLNSSGIVKLTLTSSSTVTLAFRSSDNGRTVYIGSNSYTIEDDGTLTVDLEADTYEIKKNSKESHLYAVAIQPTGPSISISPLPESTDYLTGATVTPLSVAVTFNNATASDYTVKYQWYKNTENSTTGGNIVGTNASTYTPEVTTTGTAYYYCVVTATLKSDDSKTLTATSNVATITVKDKTYTVTYNMKGYGTQIDPASDLTALPDPLPTPTATGYTFGGWYTDEALTKEATAGTGISDDITLYAKWTINKYKVTTTAQYGSIAIVDEKGYSVTSPAEVPYGTKLVFTATPNNSDYEFSSWTVTGTIGTENSYVYTIESLDAETSVRANFTETSSATYSYKVKSSDTTAPGINTSKYITRTTEKGTENLVKMTFGGWKWGTNAGKNDHTYKMPNKSNTLTDSWSAAKTEDVTKLDGYDYWFSGGQDAVDESKATNGIIYGKERFGWFQTKTTNADGTVTTHPFSLPVRGAYMTFEPTENGWLTIYILQNGAWNSDTENNIEIIPGEFRMHSFFITNQRGLTVQEFAPDMYSYEVNQAVNSEYSCSVYELNDKPAVMDKTKKDISYWPEFWTLDAKEREAVHDHWKNGTGGSETVIELSNGSFLLIQKAVIKYRFHVTGNETYYFFSNFSKMGFSGATFQPDNAQPTETLSLSDTEKYTAPTVGTNGKVDNVTIPQYKSIKLTRTFTKDRWTTLTLPFNLTQDEVQKIFGDGTQIIMLDKATLENGGARLHFIYHEIQNVLPGYPYLIKPTLTDITNDANVSVTEADNTITSFTVYGKCINPSIDPFKVVTTPYTFMGTPGYCTPDATDKPDYSVHYKANDIFVSEGDGKLYVSGDSSYGKGYRAWLQKKETGNPTAVKSISVVMSSFSDDDDTTTSIDVAEMAPDLIEALGIQTGVYNLSGQRVANDTRNLKAGIYIVNGKKTVVR